MIARLALLGLLLAACAHSGHGHRAKHGHHHGNRGPADFERYAKSQDRPARDKWQKPDEVIAAMALRPGQIVADVGSGTGYFTWRLARAVGPTGKVLALDVDERFLTMLRAKPEIAAAGNVEPRKIPTDSPGLPPASVDVAFICDTYHHIEDRVRWLRSLRAALRPGGRVVNVDFKDGPQPVGPPADHKVPEAKVRAEFEAAGFVLSATPLQLPYQYMQVFTPR